MNTQRAIIAAVSFALVSAASVFANGGAWQTGVPVTGNAAATDAKKSTNVTIEEENLTIDLHQEFAAVEVRYRMKNTGGQVDQDFFFPVEQWSDSDDDAGNTMTDLEGYTIGADGTELKFDTVDAKGAQPKAEKSKGWGDYKPAVRHWKKSSIPFAAGQSREVVIRYHSPYAANQSSVSDDGHSEDLYFRYSLAPAATWKGPIGKGKITVNYLHPRPEEITITKPKDRFKKVNDTQFTWEFQNLKPTLADDMKIVVHPGYDSYPARGDYAVDSQEAKYHADYVVEKNRYFVQHTDYDVVASSTRKPDPSPSPSPSPTAAASPEESPTESAAPDDGPPQYDVTNIRGHGWGKTWAEGVEGDGIGESITLTVHHPLPLDAILIMPGFKGDEDKAVWTRNNRVAELEITLNSEHTFTATIPDERFTGLYPIPVRDYSKPVNTVKLVIKKVHPGTDSHDTCISQLELKGKLSKKPQIQGAR